MGTRVHFCYKMVHCGTWDWCIMGFVQQVYSMNLTFTPTITTPNIFVYAVSWRFTESLMIATAWQQRSFAAVARSHRRSVAPSRLTHWCPVTIFEISETTVLKCISVDEKYCILIQISFKFVLKGLINNIPALVQIMAWSLMGDRQPIIWINNFA